MHFLSLFLSLLFRVHAEMFCGFISLKYLLVLEKWVCYLLSFHHNFSLILLWLFLLFYAQPLEGNLIFHLMDLKVLIPVHHPSPTSLALFLSYWLHQWSVCFGKSLESGLGNELQLQALLCLLSELRCLWEETSRGLEQLLSPVQAWVLRGPLSPSSGCGLEQGLACGRVPGWPGAGWPR